MKKLTYLMVIVTLALFLGLGLFSNPLLVNATNEFDKEKEVFLNITTVTKPQYYMVKSLVGDKHNVEYLFKSEDEIEKFKVDENIINNISNIDLFIYTGLNYEPWINDLIEDLKKSSLGIINISRGVRPLSYDLNAENKENPYYLLSYNDYKIALYNIKQALQERDIKNKDFYENNYDKTIKDLNDSLKALRGEVSKYKNYTVVTDTDVFDYIYKDLGINFIKVKDHEIRKILEEKNIDETKVIFVKDKNHVKKSNNEDKKESESEKIEEPLKCETIELVRFNGDISFEELILKNTKLVVDTIKKLPLE
ncbi:metal ABC transporter substrate-binding protein [Clostridium chauvoei]|uniref:Metal ABC transporter substrate-binding protein n=2 Tax=Clostridium chauvoei TaxID=46867 RepID=A0ABD4RIA2_9CLOT|nr:metal ABC transporter substrate-binding protein [Clostridium chauvoei]ATD55895.1 hypothetical protein BTM20_11905 [Clostridium chauvoei]ATD56433.1 hypothetical protein BTM21_01115 [Clostridium chauvoei]MBX7281134.1 metal ABC transporter substrate-binding protein [Clostridium chauvoei]MBX7283616.1 metal ABC transporter substrate-binding protein [Clostridium chauvoei]MBX7286224.1 metal ABC transporter substrate-binding protein [Clostridium chauvoei]